MTLTPRLEYSWFSLLEELQVDKQLGKLIFKDLCEAYSNAARHYHNLEHILGLFHSQLKSCDREQNSCPTKLIAKRE